jgi:hypothetical protein
MERRENRYDLVNRATNLHTGDIIYTLTRVFRPLSSQDGAANLKRLGELLIDWGTAPLQDFEELIKTLMWRQASRRMETLETLLQKYGGQPLFWSDDVATYSTALKEVLSKPTYLVPVDLTAAFGVDGARRLMQTLVGKFGELLCHWPAIRDAAAELRKDGHRLGKRIGSR